MPEQNAPPTLPFDSVSFEEWRARVDKDLKGVDYDKLRAHLPDGITVEPIYVAADWSRKLGEARRGDPLGHHGASWDLRTVCATADLAAARRDLAKDVARGARSLWVRLDGQARLGAEPAPEHMTGVPVVSTDQLAELLQDVDLAQMPVHLDAGANGLASAGMLLAVAARRGVAVADLKGSVACDPLGALAADGRLAASVESSADQLVCLARTLSVQAPGLRSVTVSTLPHHEAGASAAQQVGIALATGATYLRWLTDAGLDLSSACGQLQFRFGVSTDFFMEVAKLRAFRACWAKLVAACGGSPADGASPIHAVASRLAMTRRDPWVNLLRGTTEAFSAAVGGADAITLEGFDSLHGVSDDFAKRIAANAQIILDEEAHVTRVADPAGGSWYVESLTETLARDGWQVLQQLEGSGGVVAALTGGALAEQIGEVQKRLAAAVAKRRRSVTGVSEFANLEESELVRPSQSPAEAAQAAARTLAAVRAKSGSAPSVSLDATAADDILAAISATAEAGANLIDLTRALAGGAAAATCTALPPYRLATSYEALRDRADRASERPRVFLCNMGAIVQHKARATFATGFLSAGGIAVVDNDGYADATSAAQAFADSGAKAAIICGGDKQYAESAADMARALRDKGADAVLLAGRAGDLESSLREAGVADFIYMGCDVTEKLRDLQDLMGVPA